KVTLDRQERMFHFRPRTGFESLNPVRGAGFRELSSASGTHRNVPVHRTNPVFLAFVDPRVAGARPDMAFYTVQQSIGNVQVVLVDGRGFESVDEPQRIVHADMHLHPKVPLVALAGLIHLWIASVLAVLGGTRRFNNVALGDVVDRIKDGLVETPTLQEVTKIEERGLVRNTLGQLQDGVRKS